MAKFIECHLDTGFANPPVFLSLWQRHPRKPKAGFFTTEATENTEAGRKEGVRTGQS
jgi:hypothetical protein